MDPDIMVERVPIISDATSAKRQREKITSSRTTPPTIYELCDVRVQSDTATLGGVTKSDELMPSH